MSNSVGPAAYKLPRVRLALALASLAACSQVGREIVGEKQEPTRLGASACAPTPRCGQLEVEPPEELPEPAGPLDLEDCGLQPSCTVGPGQSLSCTDVLALAWRGDQLASLTCTPARLAPGQGDDASLEARQSVLRRVNLRVTSDEPASIELSHAELRHVAFELHGPLTLRLIDSAALEDVRVSADGAATIVIEGGQADGLALAADSGSASLRRVSVQHFRAQIGQLELESASLRHAEISGEHLEAADTTLNHVAMRVARMLFAYSTVSMSEIGACTSFSGLSGSFSETHVSACQEPHHIYGASFSDGRIDGALVLDRALLSTSELGVADAGKVEVWDGEQRNVSYCADQQEFAFGGLSKIICGRCDLAEVPVEPSACLGRMADVKLEVSDTCAGFAHPDSCGFGEPQRMRPPL